MAARVDDSSLLGSSSRRSALRSYFSVVVMILWLGRFWWPAHRQGLPSITTSSGFALPLTVATRKNCHLPPYERYFLR